MTVGAEGRLEMCYLILIMLRRSFVMPIPNLLISHQALRIDKFSLFRCIHPEISDVTTLYFDTLLQ